MYPLWTIMMLQYSYSILTAHSSWTRWPCSLTCDFLGDEQKSKLGEVDECILHHVFVSVLHRRGRIFCILPRSLAPFCLMSQGSPESGVSEYLLENLYIWWEIWRFDTLGTFHTKRGTHRRKNPAVLCQNKRRRPLVRAHVLIPVIVPHAAATA